MPVGAMLRQAREEKGLSLDDVAQATRINRKSLESLESDIPLKLPDTYVRAFLKAYAQYVGLDPAEVLKSAGSTTAESPAPSSAQVAPQSHGEPERIAVPRVQTESGLNTRRRQVQGLIFLSSLTAIGLVASLFWLQRERNVRPVEEVAFPEVVKEKEREQLPPPAVQPPPDTVQAMSAPQPKQGLIDSLVLEGVAVENTWVRLSIDSAAAKEYSVPPQVRMKWKAARFFILAVGNAGGMYFTLNGVRLGTFGQTDRPVSDIRLTRKTIERIDKPIRQVKKK